MNHHQGLQPRTIYYDCETNGLPASFVAHPKHWPRIVQLAWITTNQDGGIFEQGNFIVKPDGWQIPPEVEKVHGISTFIAAQSPWTIRDVMIKFFKAFNACELQVCHNVDFDLNCVNGEAWRLRNGALPFSSKPHFCTMKQTVDVVKVEKKRGSGFKWPKLEQLCEFCGVTNDKAHDAMGDVMATYLCHQYLIKNGLADGKYTVQKPGDQ